MGSGGAVPAALLFLAFLLAMFFINRACVQRSRPALRQVSLLQALCAKCRVPHARAPMAAARRSAAAPHRLHEQAGNLAVANVGAVAEQEAGASAVSEIVHVALARVGDRLCVSRGAARAVPLPQAPLPRACAQPLGAAHERACVREWTTRRAGATRTSSCKEESVPLRMSCFGRRSL